MHFPPLYLVSLSTLLLLFLCPQTGSANLLLSSPPFCGNSNFAANSTYESNLISLLGSLRTNATNSKNFGFASGMVGSVPNQLSGLVLCRGDVNSSACSSCISQASQDVQNLCPYNREATIFYDFCLLRYSNQHFLGSTDNSQQLYMWNSQNITASATKLFNDQVHDLVNTTSDYAAFNNSKKFGTAQMNTTTPVPALYGLAQCTPDLSQSDCASCLSELFGTIANKLSGTKGGRVLGVLCNVRYEVGSFYQGTPMLVLKPSEENVPAPAPAPVLTSPVLNPPATGKKKNTTGLAIAIAVGVAIAFIAILSLCFCFVKRRTKLTQPLLNVSNPGEITSAESLLLDLSVLRVATINFANENKLGEGGFGSVYKGVLPDGREIAVKRLSQTSGQGIGELKNELLLVAKLQHKNLVKLLGVCLEDQEKMLVYEYVPNKSLDQILFDAEKKQILDWGRRHKIITGIARGLLYLHEDSQLRIIHRDLKASNVLLDANMSAKISDFGLARLFGGDQTQDVTNRVVGTFGYMAPEYVMRGQFSIKSDVFSYGVLVLEIISGRRNSGTFDTEESEADLLSFVWEHWINGTITEITDPSLGQNYPTGELLRCIQIAILCVQDNPSDRPTMSNVVVKLSSETVSLEQPSRPAFCIGSNGMRDGSFSNMSSAIRGNYSYEKSSKSVGTFSPNEVSITDVEAR